jgi:hypothetical protein
MLCFDDRVCRIGICVVDDAGQPNVAGLPGTAGSSAGAASGGGQGGRPLSLDSTRCTWAGNGASRRSPVELVLVLTLAALRLRRAPRNATRPNGALSA